RLCSAEVSDAGHDDGLRLGQFGGLFRREKRRAKRGERLPHRGQVPGLVVDQGNHRSPFVLGSIFARRLSRATATRNARANALQTASTWWWLERPYSTFTCTSARAPIATPSKKS